MKGGLLAGRSVLVLAGHPEFAPEERTAAELGV